MVLINMYAVFSALAMDKVMALWSNFDFLAIYNDKHRKHVSHMKGKSTHLQGCLWGEGLVWDGGGGVSIMARGEAVMGIKGENC